MANTIKSSGTFSVQLGSTANSYNGDLTLNISGTGSNAVSEVKDIPSGSFTALNTSSLSDIKYMYFSNENTGSIQVAIDTAFTKVLTTLEPNDDAKIAWSGSIASSTLYARGTNMSGSQLYYILVER